MADQQLKKSGMLGYLHGICRGLSFRKDLPEGVREILQRAVEKTDKELEELKNNA